MGAIHATVTVRNPADRERSWEGRFLVDTRRDRHPRAATASRGDRPGTPEAAGPTRWLTAAPSSSMSPARTSSSWASTPRRPLSSATTTPSPCSESPALESAGIEVDPRNQELKHLPALWL